MIDLKPCPICGKVVTIKSWRKPNAHTTSYKIVCGNSSKKCGISSPTFPIIPALGRSDQHQQQCIDHWNALPRSEETLIPPPTSEFRWTAKDNLPKLLSHTPDDYDGYLNVVVQGEPLLSGVRPMVYLDTESVVILEIDLHSKWCAVAGSMGNHVLLESTPRAGHLLDVGDDGNSFTEIEFPKHPGKEWALYVATCSRYTLRVVLLAEKEIDASTSAVYGPSKG